ncbi:hypothetical protein T03_1792 [Trichinella britovi]|uniref:Secreted protein n=1 Tax=Trichinella britovi TaxID=45882 RepID=A0A0V1CNS1_TRIBR|nr:hypothetical protein T03_1792 [Trichinella britovi]
MDVISGLFWLLNLLQCCDGSCANVQIELRFTNDAHEKFPDEFSHPEISRQSCRNPPIAMLLRKSNAVRWEKWKCLICNAKTIAKFFHLFRKSNSTYFNNAK